MDWTAPVLHSVLWECCSTFDMQCYWHRQRKDGLFLLNAFPCSLSSSPTTTQMSRILAGRNADGYYRSGLIWALERGCSLCMSLLIMIRVLVAETLQRCWPHPLPWADVLARGSCQLFPKSFLSFTSFLSFSLHLLFTWIFFFLLLFPYFYPTLFPCSLGEWQIWQNLCFRSLYFHSVWSSAVEQIVSLAVSIKRTAITTAVLLD